MPVPDFSPGEVLTAAAMDKIGMWLITSVSFTSGSSVNVDNCFNSDYDAYRIIVYNLSQSGAQANLLKMRVGGVDSSTGYDYGGRYTFYAGGSADLSVVNTANGWQTGAGGSTTKSSISIDIFDPNAARWTTMNSTSATFDTWFALAGRHTVNTAYDGFSLIAAGGTSFTAGTINVYGYRKG